MDNIDENLLSRPKLENSEQERAAEHGLIAERAAARGNKQEGEQEQQDGTLRQQVIEARQKKEAQTAPAKEAGAGSATDGTATLLKTAWLNIIDSFGLTLIYINLHVFGHSVFGEKIFCDLGEEWIPNSLRSSLGSEAVRSRTRAIGLLEKIILIFADSLVLFALFCIIALFIWLVNPWNVVKTAVSAVTGR